MAEPCYCDDPRCHEVHSRGCIGHRKKKNDAGEIVHGDDGKALLAGPCGRSPMKGQRVCVSHGGGAKHARQAGQARVAETELRTAFGRLADHSMPVTEPLKELQKLAGDVVAWKDFAAEKIAELETIRTVSAEGAEQVHALVVVWERAISQCSRTLEAMARLGIDERLAKIDERMADAVIAALNAGLGAAGVTGEAATNARTAAARHLRKVS